MIKYRKPQAIRVENYSGCSENLEVRYGLPAEVIYCSRCVISNQRPNSAVEFRNKPTQEKTTIGFDGEGVCDACRFSEFKNNEIDWNRRRSELQKLCDKHRSRNGSFDCVVPGSGGKDSFYASHVLRTQYGMNPLTVTWAPNLYTDWGWKNYQRWIHAGHTNLLTFPNGRVHRLLTRLSTELLFHPFQAFMVGQKALAPKMALLHKIPLVFYGENEAEYGNPIADAGKARRDESYHSADDTENLFLGGVSVPELREDFQLTNAELAPYLPAKAEDLAENNIEVHYLGYYMKWHPQSCYYYAVEHGGFEPSPERTPGTYSKYNSIDDKIDDFHYYTTGVKFGLGRASYDAAQEIRSGDIDKSEGVALVNKFDHEFPHRFADEIFSYLSLDDEHYPHVNKFFEQPKIDREYFDLLTDSFRSPHLWEFKNGSWSLRFKLEG